jgi:hypothetical protein
MHPARHWTCSPILRPQHTTFTPVPTYYNNILRSPASASILFLFLYTVCSLALTVIRGPDGNLIRYPKITTRHDVSFHPSIHPSKAANAAVHTSFGWVLSPFSFAS